MRPVSWIVAVALVCLLLLAVIGGNILLQRYLSGPAFLRLISEKTSQALGVEGGYAPLRWSGSSAYSENFRGAGTGAGPLQRIDAVRIRTEFNWRAVFEGAWHLDDVTAGTLDLEFADAAARPASAGLRPQAASKAPGLPAWLPQRFEIGRLDVESATVRTPWGALHGTRAALTREGQSWLATGRGGRLEIEGLPPNSVESIRARASSGSLFVTECKLRLDGGGSIRWDGEHHSADNRFALRADWTNIDAQTILPGNLRAHLSGLVEGTATVSGSPAAAENVSTTGSFRLTDGRLDDIPALRTLAKFTRSPQFERMPVQEMAGDFQKTAEGVRVRNFVIESRGLLRLEGDFFVAADDSLEGNFQLGLTPHTLRWLPGSRNNVFTVSRDGYLWTPVRITGNTANPSEDLSTRLVAAMGTEVLDTGAKVIEKSTDTAVEGVRTVIDILSPLLP